MHACANHSFISFRTEPLKPVPERVPCMLTSPVSLHKMNKQHFQKPFSLFCCNPPPPKLITSLFFTAYPTDVAHSLRNFQLFPVTLAWWATRCSILQWCFSSEAWRSKIQPKQNGVWVNSLPPHRLRCEINCSELVNAKRQLGHKLTHTWTPL